MSIGPPVGRWSDENRLGAGSGRDRREGWPLRAVNRPALLEAERELEPAAWNGHYPDGAPFEDYCP